MQALRKLNVKAKAFTSEILEEALLVTNTTHPNDTKVGDLTKITDEQLDHVANSAKACGHILFAAGHNARTTLSSKEHRDKG